MDRRSFTKAFGLTVSATVWRRPARSTGASSDPPPVNDRPHNPNLPLKRAPARVRNRHADFRRHDQFRFRGARRRIRSRAFRAGARARQVARAVTTDANVRVVPNLGLEDAPPLDLLFVRRRPRY